MPAPYPDPTIYLDANGDGLLDAVKVTPYPQEGPWQLCLHVGFGHEAVCRPTNIVGPLNAPNWRKRAYVSDINGDGLDDILTADDEYQPLKVFLNRTPNPFTAPVAEFEFVGEFDVGDRDKPATSTMAARDGRIALTDVNADGLPDVLFQAMNVEDWDEPSAWTDPLAEVIPATRAHLQRPTENALYRDRMVRAEDGLGALHEVEYEPLLPLDYNHAGIHHPDEDCSYPIRCMRNGAPVVSSYSRSQLQKLIPSGSLKHEPTSRTLTYAYHGARTDLRGRGFLGFRRIEVYDASTATTIETEYDLSPRTYTYPTGGEYSVYPGAGRVAATRITTVLGAQKSVVKERLVTYEDTLHDGWYSSRRRRTTSTITEYAGGAPILNSVATSVSTFGDFDEFDFAKSEIHVSPEGRIREETLVPGHDQARWLIGRVVDHDVLWDDGAAQERRRTTYGYSASTGALEHVRLEPDAVGGPDPSREREVHLSYGPGGVVTQVDDTDVANASTRTMHLTYDVDGVFPVARENAMGHATQVEYDGRTGTVRRAMDRNCVVTEYHHDLFGREVLQAVTGGPSVATVSARVG